MTHLTYVTLTTHIKSMWLGMVEVCMGFDPEPGTPVSSLPFASQEARNLMLGFLRDEGGEEKGSAADCTVHLRPEGHLCDVLLSMTLVTKTELGDLVLVGQEMDPKLAGILGSAAPGNEDTISDLTSATFETMTETLSLSERMGKETEEELLPG